MTPFYEGGTLILPNKFTLIPGVSYESIAERYGITMDEFLDLNCDLGQTAVIYPGGTVFLPPEKVEKIPDKKLKKQWAPYRHYEYPHVVHYEPS